MYTCELLSVGTELLLGDILNTNAQFLARRLAEIGISVMHQSTVGDNPQRLKEAFENALKYSDIVLATGGLGPTADDITRETACELMGFELEQDEKIADGIKSFFVNRGLPMPETNLRQAMVPVGGTVFENTCGTAPGMALEKDGKCIILLPGPPREMEAMFNLSVKPFLKKYSSGAIISHNIRTMGIGESAMAEKVSDLLDMSNPTVAPYAKEGEALLRVTAFAENEDEAQKLCEPIIEEIKKRLSDYVYGTDDTGIQHCVVRMLKERGLKVAFAESCTGGYIAKRITDVSGASDVFECGVVSYSEGIKMKLLGVSGETLEKYSVYSQQVAEEMATGIKNLSGADIGVSVTGLAGPEPSGDKPAGLYFLGICDKNGVTVERVETGRNQREYNRYTASSRALNLVRKRLIEFWG